MTAVTLPASGAGDATPKVATEQITGTLEHKQVVALAVPGTASVILIPADAANGLDVDVTRVQGTVTTDPSDRAARLLGHVTVDSAPSTAVTGPLTDTQLRASRVPVDASGVAVPVTDNGGSLTVDGPLTDAQLRAAAITANVSDALEVSGTLGANGQVIASTNVQAYKSVSLHLTGTLAGTVTLEGSNDGADWRAITVVKADVVAGGGASPVTGITTIPSFYLANLNHHFMRVTISGFVSGSVTVTADLFRRPMWYHSNAVAQGAALGSATAWLQNLSQVGGVAVTLGQKVMASSVPVALASDQGNVPVNLAQVGGSAVAVEPVPTGGFGNPAQRVFVNSIRKATYFVNAVNISSGALVANTAKAVLSLEHALASTKNARIRRIVVSGLATAAGGAVVTFNDILISKGTAASSAGTAVTPSKANEAQGAADTVCKTLPTITAAGAGPRWTVLTSPAAGTAIGTVLPRTIVYDWSEAGSVEPLVLRSGVLESIVINVVSQSTPTIQLSNEVEQTEE